MNFKIFFKNFQTFVFRPKPRKVNAWFVKICEKSDKTVHISTFLKKISQIFRDFPGIGGRAPPPEPQQGRPPKISP